MSTGPSGPPRAGDPAAPELPEQIFRRWVRSQEEDTDDELVFRPPDYSFPPARGRAALEFGPGGEFVDLEIAPTDARRAVGGQWEVEEHGRVRVSFEDRARPPETLDIVAVDDQVLKLRRRPAP
jgi:hypothetical protein